MTKILLIIAIIAALWFIIKTVTFVRVLLTVVLGIIYIPINTLHMKIQKWYFSMRHKDEIIFYAFTPFYWIFVAITFIISVPYEFVISKDLH